MIHATYSQRRRGLANRPELASCQTASGGRRVETVNATAVGHRCRTVRPMSAEHEVSYYEQGRSDGPLTREDLCLREQELFDRIAGARVAGCDDDITAGVAMALAHILDVELEELFAAIDEELEELHRRGGGGA